MLIALYYAFMKDRSLMVDEGRSSMNGFKNPFVFLLWFQLCRLLSKRIYGVELVMPGNDIRFSGKVDGRPYDLGDKRFLTVLDYIALVGQAYIIAISALND